MGLCEACNLSIFTFTSANSLKFSTHYNNNTFYRMMGFEVHIVNFKKIFIYHFTTLQCRDILCLKNQRDLVELKMSTMSRKMLMISKLRIADN